MGNKNKQKRSRYLKRIHRKRNFQARLFKTDFREVIFNFIYDIRWVLAGACLLIGGVSFVLNAAKPQSIPKPFVSLIDEISQERLDRIKNQFPSGFKIVVLASQKIYESDQGRFPKGLSVDWKKAEYSKRAATNDSPEKIELRNLNINYPEKGLQPVSISVAFTRTKDQVTRILENEAVQLSASVLEDYGDKIVCVFGVK